ncbi:MAG: hypothetical protein QNI99_14200 [Woeseiaceae bacterium]|nr:hypothetical protein [Woeseiaceae bacterium]
MKDLGRPLTSGIRSVFLSASFLTLAACGGGGGGGGNSGPSNSPPTVNAGSDQTVFELTTVNLSGTASDADGDTITYEWSQTAGTAVTIDDPSSASTTFTAPDVAAGTPESLTFSLRVSDGTENRLDTVNIRIEENEAPVAAAGADRTVVENQAVQLDGSASADPNTIGTISYSWAQTGGPTVTLNDANTAVASFTAPDVAPGSSIVLDFELTVSDGTFSDTDTVTVTVEEGLVAVTVSGTVSYEMVPPNANCNGLNFAGTFLKPIRGATIQLIDDASGNVLQTSTLDNAGGYSFANVASNTQVRLRVRAELKQNTGPTTWDVEVRDNFVAGSSDADFGGSGSATFRNDLRSRPLYVLDGAPFDSTAQNLTRDEVAATGWNGVSYTGPRSAAPFAILDAIYTGMQFIISADPDADFAPLDAYWSVNNTLSSPSDITAGNLSASFYRSDLDSLFLLGDSNVDTEEFDDHVVVHEWGHYFEDNFSRSDSIGGPHALGQSIDARLAFGEGWASALAAMALDEPLYCDTGPPGTSGGFGFNAETSGFGVQGWYNEISVVTFLYDLYDTTNDGTDNDSIGFTPIYNTMVGPQAVTPAYTTIFSFAAELRSQLNPSQQAFLDSQLARESITPTTIDIWGSTETNDFFGNRDVLPLYTDIVADGSVTNICVNNDFDSRLTGNKLAVYRYLRLTIPATDQYDVLIQTTTPTPPTADPNDRDQSDPDMYIWRNGQFVTRGISGAENVESFTTPTLLSGTTYVADLQEFRYEDDDPTNGTPATFPGQICFDVSFTATP